MSCAIRYLLPFIFEDAVSDAFAFISVNCCHQPLMLFTANRQNYWITTLVLLYACGGLEVCALMSSL